MGAAVLMLWSALALATTCDLTGPADARFEIVPPRTAARVQLIVEVWADGSSAAWAEGVLGALRDRELSGVLVVPLPPADGPDGDTLALIGRAAAGGHEIAVRLPFHDVPRDLHASVSPLRDRLRPYRKAAGSVKSVVTPLPGRATEALLGKAGFRTMLPTDGAATAAPRAAAVFEGRQPVNVVLQAGPYTGACGSAPLVGPFTPGAADRAARAIHGAIRAPAAPTVRVALDGRRAADTDDEVLGRWLDEIVLPAGVRVVTPSVARKAARVGLRTEVAPPKEAEVGGRTVALEQVRQAADALSGVQILPRNLPGELGLSEAMNAFLLVLAERREGDVVRLGALEGPPSQSRSQLGQEDVVEIPRATVVAFARQLLAELPREVPVSMRVGGRLLTAPELLGLLASAVRGEDPSVTRISASPDPNARGQGWGAATVP